MTQDQIKQIMGEGRSYFLEKGQVIQSTQDRQVFNLIKSGYVKRYLISAEGDIRVQVIYGPGEFFPITLAFKILLGHEDTRSPEVFYYETMTPVELKTVNQSVIIEAANNDPEIYKSLSIVSAHRLSSTLNGLENVTMGNSYKRVAHKLAFLARNFGKSKNGKILIDVPLTQQDIADILSITRETVSTAMNKLKKEGLVQNKRNIIINDIAKLEELAYS